MQHLALKLGLITYHQEDLELDLGLGWNDTVFVIRQAGGLKRGPEGAPEGAPDGAHGVGFGFGFGWLVGLVEGRERTLSLSPSYFISSGVGSQLLH